MALGLAQAPYEAGGRPPPGTSAKRPWKVSGVWSASCAAVSARNDRPTRQSEEVTTVAARNTYQEDQRSPLLAELSLAVGSFLLALGVLQEWANIVSKRKYGRPRSIS
jgi:hypothetical protein